MQNSPTSGAVSLILPFLPQFPGQCSTDDPSFAAEPPKVGIRGGGGTTPAAGNGDPGASWWHLPTGGDTIHMAAALLKGN